MIYYPGEAPTPSWAGGALGAMGYNKDPAKLQTFIRKTFTDATSKIRIPGTQVIPVPLFNVLDGKRTADYVARVEPSAQGGRVMAEFLLDLIHQSTNTNNNEVVVTMDKVPTAPQTSYMQDRR
eukprot:CAMPEP_0116556862 /NCGR_PEP_ID=MMETSP0397-20121206/8930_1 /TAXON_ID=216820 /ORGANISM="Cyclophora tenuis, Strain ECT3854" /LENGTH=122 /DNA_ID=CAMNT_0004082275 /DNA_START=269 /DNA_END=637 /DNA_ORIENTATION=+